MTIWVTANDRYLGNYGRANNRISKHIYVCDTEDIANDVLSELRNRSDLKHINVCFKRPRYNNDWYDVIWRNSDGKKIDKPKLPH